MSRGVCTIPEPRRGCSSAGVTGRRLGMRRSAAKSPASISHQSGPRAGLTLLEVLISVAIFLSSLAAIMQLLAIGKRAEMMTRLQTEAVMRCEAKMAEVIAGVQPMDDVTDETLESEESSGTWQFSLMSMDSGTAGLLQVTVTVKYVVGSDTVASSELNRYMRDPQIFIDAALSETE